MVLLSDGDVDIENVVVKESEIVIERVSVLVEDIVMVCVAVTDAVRDASRDSLSDCVRLSVGLTSSVGEADDVAIIVSDSDAVLLKDEVSDGEDVLDSDDVSSLVRLAVSVGLSIETVIICVFAVIVTDEDSDGDNVCDLSGVCDSDIETELLLWGVKDSVPVVVGEMVWDSNCEEVQDREMECENEKVVVSSEEKLKVFDGDLE